MSVFRYGLVGPNFDLKMILKITHVIWKKGKQVNIPVLIKKKET